MRGHSYGTDGVYNNNTNTTNHLYFIGHAEELI